MTIGEIYELMTAYLEKECSEEIIVNVINNNFYVSNGVGGQMGGGDYLITADGTIEELEISEVGNIFDAAEKAGIPIATFQISRNEIKRLE